MVKNMKAQAELLQGTDIPTDDLGITFTPDEEVFLLVAEGLAYNEWSRACVPLGLAATAEYVPENYESRVLSAGKWDKDYPTKEQLER